MLSIPVYAAFPVAPPRLATSGLIDTITSQTASLARLLADDELYNELAAVPSLHVGFAVVIGIAMGLGRPQPDRQGLWLMWGPVIGLAVVATGNH